MRTLQVVKALACGVCVLLLASPAADAQRSGCKALRGGFTSVTVAPPACNSPVGLCTHGTLSGKLRGTYDFVALSMASANDPSAPNKVVYSGESLIETDEGQLFGQDTGFMFLNPLGVSPFQTTVHVVGGSEHYQHVTQDSFLVADGELTLGTGHAVGSYRGKLCLRRHGPGHDHCDDSDDDD